MTRMADGLQFNTMYSFKSLTKYNLAKALW